MKYLIAFFAVVIFTSCAPRLKYLGDDYGYNDDIDVYYDQFDIKLKYRTMGILTADSSDSFEKSTEKLREVMIEEAKQKGANGILFTALFPGKDEESSVIEAKLIKYL